MLPEDILRRPGHLPLNGQTGAVLLGELQSLGADHVPSDAASANFCGVEAVSLTGDRTQPALAAKEAQQTDQNEVQRHDIIQERGHDQDQDARDHGDEWGERRHPKREIGCRGGGRVRRHQ
jgi:hypothetical protein